MKFTEIFSRLTGISTLFCKTVVCCTLLANLNYRNIAFSRSWNSSFLGLDIEDGLASILPATDDPGEY